MAVYIRAMKKLLLVLALAGCDSPTLPEYVPEGAVQYEAPAVYATWWGEVEKESGLSGDLNRVRWFKVPGGPWYHEGHRKVIGGMWKRDNRIYLADTVLHLRGHVKHEMLHDLIGGEGDPNHRHPLFWTYAGHD